MTDKNFLDGIVAERMQMHYSLHKENTADGEPTNALHLEKEYTQALETLLPTVRETIERFVKSLTSRAAGDETFFYMKGLKDGLLLYKLLAGL